MCTMFSHPRVMAVGLLALWLPPPPAAAQLFGGFSDEQEIELGREAAAMMEEDLQLLQDEEVSGYVTRLGNELASNSGRADLAYVFQVVDTAEINAFALPGGFIYVHRGLIEAAENESELAGVLGHEIGTSLRITASIRCGAHRSPISALACSGRCSAVAEPPRWGVWRRTWSRAVPS
jgi:hypothetical protein